MQLPGISAGVRVTVALISILQFSVVIEMYPLRTLSWRHRRRDGLTAGDTTQSTHTIEVLLLYWLEWNLAVVLTDLILWTSRCYPNKAVP